MMQTVRRDKLILVLLAVVFCLAIAAVVVFIASPRSNELEVPKFEKLTALAKDQPITLRINSAGEIFLQGSEISLDQIVPSLEKLADGDYERRIFLRSKPDTNYTSVMAIMERTNAAGYSNIGLVTEPIKEVMDSP